MSSLTYRANGDANSYTLLDVDTGRWFMSLLNNGEQTTPQQEANMQRLAACWNACDGVSTQELTDMIFSLPNAYVQMRVERDRVASELAAIQNEAKTNQKWAFLEWRQKAEEALDQRNELSAALGISTSNFATLAAKLAQAESQRDALLVALKKLLTQADGFIESEYPKPMHEAEKKQFNHARSAISGSQRPTKTPPAITTTCPGNRPECTWVDTLPFGSKCTTCGDTLPF